MVSDPVQAARNWRETAEKRGEVIAQLLEERSRVFASGSPAGPTTETVAPAAAPIELNEPLDYQRLIRRVTEQTTPTVTNTTGDPPQLSQPVANPQTNGNGNDNAVRIEPVINPDPRSQRGWNLPTLNWKQIFLGLAAILAIVAIIYALPKLGDIGEPIGSTPIVEEFWSGAEYSIDEMERKWIPLWVTTDGQRYDLWTNDTYTPHVTARLAYKSELQKINASAYTPTAFKNNPSAGTDKLISLLKKGNATFYQNQKTDAIVVAFVSADLIRFVKVRKLDKKIDFTKAAAISSFSPYRWKNEETAKLSASMKKAARHS